MLLQTLKFESIWQTKIYWILSYLIVFELHIYRKCGMLLVHGANRWQHNKLKKTSRAKLTNRKRSNFKSNGINTTNTWERCAPNLNFLERLQFWVPLNTRGGLTRTSHGKITHWTREGALLSTTEHEAMPYTHATRCTQRWKAHTRTEKTLYTKQTCIIIHLMQMSDSVPFGVMFY